MTATTMSASWHHFVKAWRELNRIQFVAPWGRNAKRG